MIQNCLKSMKTLIRVQIKTIEYQVKVFEKKCESVFVTASVTDIFLLRILSLHLLPPVTAFVPTANTVTASVPTETPLTASVPAENYITASVPTDYPITASVPTANTVFASVTTDNPVT